MYNVKYNETTNEYEVVNSTTTEVVTSFNNSNEADYFKNELNNFHVKLSDDYKRKSDAVREAIKQVKSHYGDTQLVVEFAVNSLGMTKKLAKVYTKNNWNKV